MFNRIKQSFGAFALVALAAGCATEVAPSEPETSDAITYTDRDVQLILDLVNDPATDIELLDTEAHVEVRAAQNIVLHRNGADGVYPSADDNLFDDLEELDAIPYVGGFAMAQIHAYAVANAPLLPELVEGVYFSAEQVEAVLWGVNQAGTAELDDEVGLVRQAAENLAAGGPYASVAEIGAVPYVGPAALTALRSFASEWSTRMAGGGSAPSQAGSYDGVDFDAPTAQAALALAKTASYEELTGEGQLPPSGARAIIDHRPYTTLAQVAEAYGVGPATMQALHGYAASGLDVGTE